MYCVILFKDNLEVEEYGRKESLSDARKCLEDLQSMSKPTIILGNVLISISEPRVEACIVEDTYEEDPYLCIEDTLFYVTASLGQWLGPTDRFKIPEF